MIAANKVGNGLGFAVDDNALELFWQTGSKTLAKALKNQLARNLMTIIIEQYYAKNTAENS
jgi:phosphopantothenoylcysteine decarboxylase/phosphopantothenate--cysteine ligase